MKYISILGSTGSIGVNTLKVISSFPDRFRVLGLAARKNIELLYSQIEKYSPLAVAVEKEEYAAQLRKQVRIPVDSGIEGLVKIACLPKVRMVVSALAGTSGLVPTLKAIESGKDIGLANKEILVMAGSIIMKQAAKHQVKILPLDSEHSAVFQCLKSGQKEEVSKIILTASGGPFYNYSLKQLTKVTVRQTLSHPVWPMGRKITVDSATLMNKGLEVIEAAHLFGLGPDKIDILIHPQSIVHSLVEFVDGSVMAQMALPDMRLPIQYALTYPDRKPGLLPQLNLDKIRQLTFTKPDLKKFPGLKLALQSARAGGTMTAVLNSANEVAVEFFLGGEIRFLQIAEVVEKVLQKYQPVSQPSLEEIISADAWARQQARKVVERLV